MQSNALRVIKLLQVKDNYRSMLAMTMTKWFVICNARVGDVQHQKVNMWRICSNATFVKKYFKADTHKTFKPCRDPVNCVYQSGCYFSHVPVTTGKIRCFQCGEEFENKNTLMIHRKIHGRVRLCTKLTDSQCDRGESCWWSHNMNDQVFQQVTENLRPPIIIQHENLQPRMDLLNTPNLIMVNMLKTLNIELMKIKEVLNIK